MRNESTLLFPSQPDGEVIRIPVWIPQKDFETSFGDDKIYVSDLDDPRMIQYAVRHKQEDIIRFDNYAEGYFGANWDSDIDFDSFLDTLEEYYCLYDDVHSSMLSGEVGVFRYWTDPRFYDFDRPLKKEEFVEDEFGERLLDDPNHPLSFIAVQTEAGYITFDPPDENGISQLGISQTLSVDSLQKTVETLYFLTSQSNLAMQKESLEYILSTMPYMNEKG